MKQRLQNDKTWNVEVPAGKVIIVLSNFCSNPILKSRFRPATELIWRHYAAGRLVGRRDRNVITDTRRNLRRVHSPTFFSCKEGRALITRKRFGVKRVSAAAGEREKEMRHPASTDVALEMELMHFGLKVLAFATPMDTKTTDDRLIDRPLTAHRMTTD